MNAVLLQPLTDAILARVCSQVRAYSLISGTPKLEALPQNDIPQGEGVTAADQRSAYLQRMGAYGDDSIEDEDVV